MTSLNLTSSFITIYRKRSNSRQQKLRYCAVTLDVAFVLTLTDRFVLLYIVVCIVVFVVIRLLLDDGRVSGGWQLDGCSLTTASR